MLTTNVGQTWGVVRRVNVSNAMDFKFVWEGDHPKLGFRLPLHPLNEETLQTLHKGPSRKTAQGSLIYKGNGVLYINTPFMGCRMDTVNVKESIRDLGIKIPDQKQEPLSEIRKFIDACECDTSDFDKSDEEPDFK